MHIGLQNPTGIELHTFKALPRVLYTRITVVYTIHFGFLHYRSTREVANRPGGVDEYTVENW